MSGNASKNLNSILQGYNCTVSISLGATLNMQNYESYKINIGLSVPCDEKTMEKEYTKALKFVKAKLGEEADRVRNRKK